MPLQRYSHSSLVLSWPQSWEFTAAETRYLLLPIHNVLALTHAQSYLISNNIVNGAHNAKGRCQELQAATAFFWFLFALFMGTLVMSALGSRGGGMSSRGGMRKGGPSMTRKSLYLLLSRLLVEVIETCTLLRASSVTNSAPRIFINSLLILLQRSKQSKQLLMSGLAWCGK